MFLDTLRAERRRHMLWPQPIAPSAPPKRVVSGLGFKYIKQIPKPPIKYEKPIAQIIKQLSIYRERREAKIVHKFDEKLDPLDKMCFRLADIQRLRSWANDNSKMPLFVCGPIGCGKTVGIRTLIEEMNGIARLFDCSADDYTDESILRLFHQNSRNAKDMMGRKVFVVLDSIEALRGPRNEARRIPMLKKIGEVADDASCKVIFIVAMSHAIEVIKPLGGAEKLKVIQLAGRNPHDIADWLTLRKTCTPEIATQASKGCRGDVRQAIIRAEQRLVGTKDLNLSGLSGPELARKIAKSKEPAKVFKFAGPTTSEMYWTWSTGTLNSACTVSQVPVGESFPQTPCSR